MTAPNTISAISKAKEIIESLFIQDASDIDIDAIAMKRNAIIREGKLKGAEGRLTISSSHKIGLITVKSDIPIFERKRFIKAHELGHFELHKEKMPAFNCSDRDFNEWLKTKPLEVEANHFAAEILMPENLFTKGIKNKDLSLSLLQELKEEFHTSLTATSIRFVLFRREYALVCTENSKIKWFFIDDNKFPYYLNVTGIVHPKSISHRVSQSNDLANEFIEVPPEAWIDDYRFKNTAKVMEMAIRMPSYNQVLSFIYIEEIEDEDEEDEYCETLDGCLRFKRR